MAPALPKRREKARGAQPRDHVANAAVALFVRDYVKVRQTVHKKRHQSGPAVRAKRELEESLVAAHVSSEMLDRISRHLWLAPGQLRSKRQARPWANASKVSDGVFQLLQLRVRPDAPPKASARWRQQYVDAVFWQSFWCRAVAHTSTRLREDDCARAVPGHLQAWSLYGGRPRRWTVALNQREHERRVALYRCRPPLRDLYVMDGRSVRPYTANEVRAFLGNGVTPFTVYQILTDLEAMTSSNVVAYGVRDLGCGACLGTAAVDCKELMAQLRSPDAEAWRRDHWGGGDITLGKVGHLLCEVRQCVYTASAAELGLLASEYATRKEAEQAEVGNPRRASCALKRAAARAISDYAFP